jgi:glutaredoxin-like YruB-family protein
MEKKVIVYSSDYCPFCDQAKEFLKENKVDFEEKNVQQDKQFMEEMKEKSGQSGVPVIDIDGKIIVGFRQAEIKEALGL